MRLLLAAVMTVLGFSHSVQALDFKDLNGVMWFYSSSENIKFNDITSKLDELKVNGVRVVVIYSPYHGDRNKWLGCAPVNFYEVSPQNGTMQDFLNLVNGAHARGMKVVSYFTNIFIVKGSPFFQTAARQYKAGQHTAREASAVHWSTNPKAPLPKPAAVVPERGQQGQQDGPSQWLYSSEAGAYYWSIWNAVAFDFDLPGARAEVEGVMKFWLDIGLDGFMFDAGIPDTRVKYVMADLLKTYTKTDKWLTFESAESEEAETMNRFGLTSWFNLADDDEANDYTNVLKGKSSMDALEQAFKRRDQARKMGKLTHAWTPIEGTEQVVQEAAVLAGGGILYGPATYADYKTWSAVDKKNWGQVMAAVNDNKSLLPSASRKRLPTIGNQRVFAMKRVSEDHSQTALLIYNFRNTATDVEVDLRNAGISTSQMPRDLLGGTAAPINGASYKVNVPAYGFKFLSVK